MKKFPTLFLIFLISISLVYGVSLFGMKFRYNLMFEPGYVGSYGYTFANNGARTMDFEGYVKTIEGGNITDFFEIQPQYFKDVKPGETRDFSIRLRMPDSSEHAGDNTIFVGIKEVVPPGAGIVAATSAAIRYDIFILFPYKYITYGFSTSNMNVNESRDFTLNFRNLGEPVIDKIEGYVDFYSEDPDSPGKIGTKAFEPVSSLQPKASAERSVEFDSRGLDPGDYRAVAHFTWDDNESTIEKPFMVGSKNVNLLDYTDEFVPEAINKMTLNVESRWNTLIEDIYANVEILDGDDTVANFKSFKDNLGPWSKKELEAYFDTHGLEEKQYNVRITLNYDGVAKVEEGIVTIKSDSDTIVVEEIPGKFSLKGMFTGIKDSFEGVNVLLLVMALLIVVNLGAVAYLILKKEKKEKTEEKTAEKEKKIERKEENKTEKKEEKKDVDEVIEMLKKIHDDEKIRELLKKKGWKDKQIDEILNKK